LAVDIVEYDAETDILTVHVQPGVRVVDEELLDNDVVVSYDGNGRVVQVQVLWASRRGLLEALAELYRAKRALLEYLMGRGLGHAEA